MKSLTLSVFLMSSAHAQIFYECEFNEKYLQVAKFAFGVEYIVRTPTYSTNGFINHIPNSFNFQAGNVMVLNAKYQIHYRDPEMNLTFTDLNCEIDYEALRRASTARE